MKSIIDRQEKQINTTDLIKALNHSFSVYAKLQQIENHPSVFLKGQPGVGKSQAVYRIANHLEETLKKKVVVTDVRLMMFNPVDLRGIPVADHQTKVAIWLRPQIFQLSDSSDIINILFLDELTSAPQSIQVIAYQIALDRKIGEHVLPKNTFVIAAGNRQEDDAMTYNMPSALKNRFMHFEVVTDVNDWLNWSKSVHIHPKVIEFITENPQYFTSPSMDTSSNIVITPRTWEMLSKMLYTLGVDESYHDYFVASLIGEELATEFNQLNHYITLNDLLKGKIKVNQRDLSMIQRVVDLIDQGINVFISDEQSLNHIFAVLLDLPIDHAIRIFKLIIKNSNVSSHLFEIPNYREFIRKLEKQDE